MPLQLVAMAIVFLSDFRNPIFVQSRVGLNQKAFMCYKIRTMTVGTPNAASHEISQAHVTWIGRFLRASKFDELPQLMNVLKDDMSFVGPRPCLPSQHELISARQTLGVFSVRPGITGLAQVNGIDMSDPKKLADIDARYIREKSGWMDFKLCVQTISGAGSGDKTANG
jgi:O-antigen biosynthesis protein WbqP